MSYTLQPKPQHFSWKIFIFFPEKNPFWKSILYLGKWNFLAPRLKKFLCFLKKMFFYIFREMELSSPKIKKLLEGASGAWKIKKITLKKFLIFQEMELSRHKLKKLIFSRNNFSYISRVNLENLKIKIFFVFLHKMFSPHFRITADQAIK